MADWLWAVTVPLRRAMERVAIMILNCILEEVYPEMKVLGFSLWIGGELA
jgi:hypothetical protein